MDHISINSVEIYDAVFNLQSLGFSVLYHTQPSVLLYYLPFLGYSHLEFQLLAYTRGERERDLKPDISGIY